MRYEEFKSLMSWAIKLSQNLVVHDLMLQKLFSRGQQGEQCMVGVGGVFEDVAGQHNLNGTAVESREEKKGNVLSHHSTREAQTALSSFN